MKTNTKIILIASSVVVATGVTLTVLYFRNKAKQEEEARQKAENIKKEEEKKAVDSGYLIPKYNRNKELINPLSELKLVTLITKNETTNLRSSPKVDDGWTTNKLASIKGIGALGKVVSEHKGEETPAMRWFKVKLIKPVYGLNTLNIMVEWDEVYVRADVVTFNKIKKA